MLTKHKKKKKKVLLFIEAFYELLPTIQYMVGSR
jgi:hypothetical protein